MSAGFADRLYLPGGGPVHTLPPVCKLVAVLAFTVVVVATPREHLAAFGGYLVLLLAVAAVARVPPGFLARRLLIEVPFLAFALALPFFAHGERVDVLGLSLSAEGLWGAWNIVAKGTLGVLASLLLAATTRPHLILGALRSLGMPGILVQIAGLMLRYFEVIAAELDRMRIARESRGFQARHLGHARVVAQSAGALFIRAYERGERVHLAMLSRGYTGAMPPLGTDGERGGAVPWLIALSLPAAALAVAVAGWLPVR
ncbi:cobalt ECF transporter T component CbiQ [Allonocardiopsis opalescens]|uniref:Cobalt/nickel transport system permease protein n=1 Tax=Allonocardiopsis opalescens TaxID=1144618 RepID=A0A2T0PX87_9ACTN|nr:cobalt ECF transporter T component CbiQ [Allonocardiopsis opalescens]PRX96141.1 cobalt/nickel transport system permease protein [Allonocardiopsis opalescens]